MALDEETNVFGMTPGCPIHGDEKMRECSMCGAEFCRRCFPRSTVCPDCAEPAGEDDEEADPDFEDVKDLDDVLDDEDEDGDEDEDPDRF